MATRTLTVNLIGRADKLNKSFKNASRGADTMAGKMMKATRMAGIGFTALGGVAVGAAMALKPMIDKAADVEESISKNRLMFGEASKAVEQFAETSLDAFGVTRREALDATGTFGNLGKAMGMAEADSAAMATTLTGLAGDMSSLHNVRVDEALTALRAGLIGEAEPLRRFGILLDAATIKTKALELGLIGSTKEAVTPAIKSQASYALILEKGAVAMGDFTRTSDSAVNQQKKLSGAWDDLQIQIGEKLLPQFTRLVTYANDTLMPALESVIDMDWSEFTFDDLITAMADANVDVIAFMTETGLNWAKAAGDGMIAQFESKQAEEGTRTAVIDTIHNALSKSPGITFASGITLGLWRRIFGEGAEASAALQERLDALRIAAAVGDALDVDRTHLLTDTSVVPSGLDAIGSVAALEAKLEAARIAAELAITAAADAEALRVAEAAAAEALRIAEAATADALILEAAERVAAAEAAKIEAEKAAALKIKEAEAAAAAIAAALADAVILAAAEALRVAEAAAADALIKTKVPDGPVGGVPTLVPTLVPLLDASTIGFGDGHTGDPGQRGGTTVVINAAPVTAQEVVDLVGKYVDNNGPLPPHWQQTRD